MKVLETPERAETVAQAVTQFMHERFGTHSDSPIALEGLVLAMQILGGPSKAAQMIGYCFKVD